MNYDVAGPMVTARQVAENAKCRRSKVGAVIVRGGQVVAVGANGTVAGQSCLDGGCPRGLRSYEEAPPGTPSVGADKCIGIHAEMAAILSAARRGVGLRDAVLMTTKSPCRSCLVAIHVAGISLVVVDELELA